MPTITIDGVDYEKITGTGIFELSDWTGSGSPAAFMIDGFSSVADDALYNATTNSSNTIITHVHIGNTVISIGENAIRNCTNLISVTFESDSQLDTIGKSAFQESSALTSITLPESLTSIGVTAFYLCSSLDTVIFESGSQLMTIGDSAFAYSGLSGSITLPASLTSIGNTAFYNSGSLISVTIDPLNTTFNSIGTNAFNGTSLSNFYAPTTVLSASHLNLTAGSTATIGGQPGVNVYNNIISDTGVFETSDWSGAGSPAVFMISGFSSVGPHAFNSNTTITHVHIGNTVTSIGDSAFRVCVHLTSVTFESGSQLDTIGDWSFYQSGLSGSITLPASPRVIGSGAFYQCSSLHTVYIDPLNTTFDTIGTNAFYDSGLANFYATTTVLGNLSLTAGVGINATIGGHTVANVYSYDNTPPTMDITSTTVTSGTTTNDASIALTFTSSEATI